MPVAWRFLAAAYDATPPEVLKMLRQWPRPSQNIPDLTSPRRVVECDSDSSGHVKTFATAQHGFTAASRKDLSKSWLKVMAQVPAPCQLTLV